jgi:hypothetical protein
MGKNKKREKEKEKERIKIVKSSAREFTFVEDIYTPNSFINNTATRDLDEKNSKDTRKLSDIRNRHKIESTHDFQYKSKGRNIRSKQGHSPVYE